MTAGNTRSEDELRAEVEQMMLAAGNRNPDVRLTGTRGHRASANVQVDAEIDNEDQILQDMRRDERIDQVPRLPATLITTRARAKASGRPTLDHSIPDHSFLQLNTTSPMPPSRPTGAPKNKVRPAPLTCKMLTGTFRMATGNPLVPEGSTGTYEPKVQHFSPIEPL